MTEQKYIQTFARAYWKWWLAALLVGLALGWYLAHNVKPSYEGTVSVLVSRNPESISSNAPVYRYDGYYGEQAAFSVRNTFITWVKSPQTVINIYRAAGVEDKARQAGANVSKLFVVPDAISNQADVTFRYGDEATAHRLGQALVNEIKTNYQPADYTIKTDTPAIVAVVPPQKVVVAGAAFALLLIVFTISLLYHYFSEPAER